MCFTVAPRRQAIGNHVICVMYLPVPAEDCLRFLRFSHFSPRTGLHALVTLLVDTLLDVLRTSRASLTEKARLATLAPDSEVLHGGRTS